MHKGGISSCNYKIILVPSILDKIPHRAEPQSGGGAPLVGCIDGAGHPRNARRETRHRRLKPELPIAAWLPRKPLPSSGGEIAEPLEIFFLLVVTRRQF